MCAGPRTVLNQIRVTGYECADPPPRFRPSAAGSNPLRQPPLTTATYGRLRRIPRVRWRPVAHRLRFHDSSRGHRNNVWSHNAHTYRAFEATRTGGNDMKLYVNLYTRLQSLMHGEEGQDLLEYALLVALIALVAVAGVTLAGTNVNAIFGTVAAKIVAPST
jgi:pilus assembly protein Flp/PilA